MKYNYHLIILLIGVTICSAVSWDANIEKPCGSDINLACVKKYFSDKSSCSVVDEANDSPVYEENLPIYLPYVDLTVVTTKTTLTQLDGNIEEFYYNKWTGKLVISVKYTGLVCDAPDAVFAISRNGMEPLVFTEDVKATYPIVLTAVIPARFGISAESLKFADYSAYMGNSNAVIDLGPKFTETTDPVVQEVLDGILNDLPTALTEIFRTKASYFFLAYLQNYICDFDFSPVLEPYDLTVFNSVKDVDVNDDSQFKELCSNSDEEVTDCVRDYFKENGRCLVVRNPNDDPLQRGGFTIPIPSLNSIVYGFHGEFIHGSLRGMIRNFYINKQTDNLVMSVEFIANAMHAPVVHLYTHHRDRESTWTSDYTTNIYQICTFVMKKKVIWYLAKSVIEMALIEDRKRQYPVRPVILTAVIPISEGLTSDALKKAFVTGHLTQPPMFVIGPKFTESTDPNMVDLMDILFDDTMKIGKECLVTEASQLFLAYIQKYFCNFIIPV